MRHNQLPSVLTSTTYRGSNLPILLLSDSDLFNHDTIVSVYLKREEGFEQLIGYGVVLNIQENKKIQVGFEYVLDGNEEILKKIQEKNSDLLKSLIVKPTAPKSFLQRVN